MTNKTTAQEALAEPLRQKIHRYAESNFTQKDDQWWFIKSITRFLTDKEYFSNTDIDRAALEAMAEPVDSSAGNEVTVQSGDAVDLEALKRECRKLFPHARIYNNLTGNEMVDRIIDHLNQRGLIATGWRDTSIAPKDGTQFLATSDGDIFICWWETGLQREGWFSGRFRDMWGDYPEYEAPTHWMPLPPSPKGQSDE